MFLMGDRSDHRSGDRTSQDRNRTSRVSRKIRTQRAICGLALYCWKMVFDRPRIQGTATGRMMSEMYDMRSNYCRS